VKFTIFGIPATFAMWPGFLAWCAEASLSMLTICKCMDSDAPTATVALALYTMLALDAGSAGVSAPVDAGCCTFINGPLIALYANAILG
jgi:hypothetical protein